MKAEKIELKDNSLCKKCGGEEIVAHDTSLGEFTRCIKCGRTYSRTVICDENGNALKDKDGNILFEEIEGEVKEGAHNE